MRPPPARRAAPLPALLALALLAGPAAAAPASPWAERPESAVRIVAAAEATGAAGTVPLGLHFRLAEGWKIYWRSPGDAGLPPQIDAGGSGNLAGLALRWPAPEQFDELGGLVTRGYAGEVVLPLEARLARAGGALALRARVDYQVCETVCIPASADLALDLPAGEALPSPFARLIARHEARVPVPPAAAGLAALEIARAGPAELLVAARWERPVDAAPAGIAALVEGPPGITFRSGAAEVGPGGRTVRVPVSVQPPDAGGLLAGREVGVTLVAGAAAAEDTVRIAPAAPAAGGAASPLGIFLLLALAGGLILNLMPCVLPVLALKLASVVDTAGASRGKARASFLATSAGIVASFAALAAGVVALREAGHAAGWGFQFQSPAFLAFLTVVIVLFAANLWGWFEVAAPAPLLRLVPAAGAGPGGAFAQGAFATLLATPCAAPVVGTAVGFALARGPLEIVLVFLGLGAGMSLPWLAVAAWPRALALLPRPGRWMRTLRRALALPLLATAVWLLAIVRGVAGDAPALGVALLAAAAAAALGLARRREPARPLRAAALALAAGAVALPMLGGRGDAVTRSAPDGAEWTALAPAAIPALAREGLVFVDVTADWCVTCLVNKNLVLDRGEVRRALAGDGVVRMRGDWTLPDPAIAAYLAGFGRYGIPFNAVYGPGTPDGEALPEILTPGAVLAALERAAGPPPR